MQSALEQRHEVERRTILGRKDADRDQGWPLDELAKPSWEKEDSPLTGTARAEAQHGMIQVTPVLAPRRRNREGSGDTWRTRSRPGSADDGRPRADEGSPNTRGDSAQTGGRCWAGQGLEFGRRGGRWSVGRPTLAGRSRTEGFRERGKGDSWAVGEESLEEGKWCVGTPPPSTRKVPVSSGWGPGLLSRIGGEDLCWDGDEGCFPTRLRGEAGNTTRKVLFPGPGA